MGGAILWFRAPGKGLAHVPCDAISYDRGVGQAF
jgi:hypothetical protein